MNKSTHRHKVINGDVIDNAPSTYLDILKKETEAGRFNKWDYVRIKYFYSNNIINYEI